MFPLDLITSLIHTILVLLAMIMSTDVQVDVECWNY